MVLEIVFIVAIALSTTMLTLLCLKASKPPVQTPQIPDTDQMSLLFDDGILHHASTTALKQFAFFPGTHVWDDLRDRLLNRFPDFPETAGSGSEGTMTLYSKQAEDCTTVEMNWRDGMCWVHLTESELPVRAFPLSGQNATQMDRFARTMAQPVWEMDNQGVVIWCNSAFAKLANRIGRPLSENPFAHFEKTDKQRCVVTDSKGAEDWFEVTTHKTDVSTMHHAICITALVKAEVAQRTFVQTLAKTFAHLPVGLAIFDKHGQLSIFNPALVDLSGLQASFLATRPTMMSFFDALRENRRMPEPKNYRCWRQDIADVIAAASDGLYLETWSLDDGRTYSVQGRPHPDGATAFLIDDISAEITLSRSYRAEVAQFESLLDSVGDALVVFSSTGMLTFCNSAYREMWGQDPDAAFADVTIKDSIDVWASKTQGHGPWDEITVFASTLGTRPTRKFDLYQSDGRAVRCRAIALTADATLIRFSRIHATVDQITTLVAAKKTSNSEIA
ncbi:PAS-domain containing protein [Sulfitobacter sp. F26204]|uniref:PAS-domain containing protein n=1 Tax=Sulfitobacter sp. F26204 TaxID=2996014 RepID=UPI00225DD594|nr:PAS-domain containing protein [Sulfitobacter sp. F26204]MCX7558227.1 PAS-domain containing protein [Sulfitobacter sp. F26204]